MSRPLSWLTDVRAVGVGNAGRLEEMRRLQAGRHAVRGSGHRGNRGEAAELDPAIGIGALGKRMAVLLDVILRDAE